MKKGLVILLFSLLFKADAQPITYTFTALGGAYTPLVGPTAIPEIYWGADNELSGIYNIGFTFKFGCTAYTQFKVSADGWLTFNLSFGVSFADAINDLPNYTQMRPGIAPLWDDLCWNNNNPPQCGYQLSGVSPNRILTIQWIKANWKILGTAPGEMSFQVKLYETTNRIEMIYHQETGTLNAPSASIGLAGPAVGDYYSVNTAFTAASKAVNTQNIATKVPEGQIFRWDPPCNTALPIGLLSFSGENKHGRNLLKWSTAEENNNDYFVLERSEDALNFTEVTKIKGAGNSNKKTDYEFWDYHSKNKTVYYRLRQVDFNRTSSYSEIISLDEISGDELDVYPNPASTIVIIGHSENKAYSILDISGKKVKEGTIINSELNIAELNDGMYFLNVEGSLPKKLVVRH